MSYHTRLKKDLDGAAAAGLLSPEQAAKTWERSCSERAFSSFKAASSGSVMAKVKIGHGRRQLLDLVKKL